MNPLQLFSDWYSAELKVSKARIPSACCLSTIGLDHYPNSRFVSLKEIIDDAFIVTGPLNARKGLEIQQTNKVALAFWWTESERQLRIQGNATRLSEQMADKYFSERGVDSQIVSLISEQGKEIDNPESLNKKYREAEIQYTGKAIPRPVHWGVYAIKPVRIEFMEFRQTRFHNRMLYELINDKWTLKQLQP